MNGTSLFAVVQTTCQKGKKKERERREERGEQNKIYSLEVGMGEVRRETGGIKCVLIL